MKFQNGRIDGTFGRAVGLRLLKCLSGRRLLLAVG
jgi:hypothetical protein